MKLNFFKIAKQESLKSNHQFQIGCVIVSGSRILSRGYNQIRHLKRGKKFTEYDCSLHAERDACSKLDKSIIKGSDIYIFREYKDNRPALAAPCDQCLYMLVELGVRIVYHTINEFPFYHKLKL